MYHKQNVEKATTKPQTAKNLNIYYMMRRARKVIHKTSFLCSFEKIILTLSKKPLTSAEISSSTIASSGAISKSNAHSSAGDPLFSARSPADAAAIFPNHNSKRLTFLAHRHEQTHRKRTDRVCLLLKCLLCDSAHSLCARQVEYSSKKYTRARKSGEQKAPTVGASLRYYRSLSLLRCSRHGNQGFGFHQA
jgi:hypothetical protein